jgi:beta-galactosidase
MNRRELFKGASALGLVTLPGGVEMALAQRSVARSSIAVAPAKVTGSKTREVLSLNKGWRIVNGDIPFPKVMGHGWSYANAKAGRAQGAANADCDDSETASRCPMTLSAFNQSNPMPT